MDDAVKAQNLDFYIEGEKGSIKWNLILAIFLFIAGSAMTVFIYLDATSSISNISPDDLAKLSVDKRIELTSSPLQKFLSAIPVLLGGLASLFPVNSYFSRKERINSCKILQNAYKSPPVPEEVNEIYWSIIGKGAEKTEGKK